MPGCSFVRPFNPRVLKATKSEIERKKNKTSQDWFNLTPHCPPPLESFDSSSFNWKVAWPNQTRRKKKKTIAQDATG